MKTDLQELQPQRRLVDPETAAKLDQFITKIDNLLSLEVTWTLVKFIIYNKNIYSYSFRNYMIPPATVLFKIQTHSMLILNALPAIIVDR